MEIIRRCRTCKYWYQPLPGTRGMCTIIIDETCTMKPTKATGSCGQWRAKRDVAKDGTDNN